MPRSCYDLNLHFSSLSSARLQLFLLQWHPARSILTSSTPRGPVPLFIWFLIAAMAMPPNTTFRFLDLPPELRRAILEQVFDGSTISITEPVDDAPVDSYDDLLKLFNLAKYHSAITLGSKSIRNECILLLHKATTLVFNEQVMFNLVHYLESCPQHLL
jgi:hypothetical protein